MLLLLFIELWNFFLSSNNVIGWLRIRKYNLLFTTSNGPPTLWSEESREIKSRLDGEARKCNDDNSQPPHCVNFEIQRKHCAGTASFFFFLWEMTRTIGKISNADRVNWMTSMQSRFVTNVFPDGRCYYTILLFTKAIFEFHNDFSMELFETVKIRARLWVYCRWVYHDTANFIRICKSYRCIMVTFLLSCFFTSIR